jgi:hypothetical protein
MARITRARARVANAIRHHPDDPEAIAAARSDLRGAVAEDRIRKIVDGWPPLSAETRAALAVIILSGGDHAAT